MHFSHFFIIFIQISLVIQQSQASLICQKFNETFNFVGEILGSTNDTDSGKLLIFLKPETKLEFLCKGRYQSLRFKDLQFGKRGTNTKAEHMECPDICDIDVIVVNEDVTEKCMFNHEEFSCDLESFYGGLKKLPEPKETFGNFIDYYILEDNAWTLCNETNESGDIFGIGTRSGERKTFGILCPLDFSNEKHVILKVSEVRKTQKSIALPIFGGSVRGPVNSYFRFSKSINETDDNEVLYGDIQSEGFNEERNENEDRVDDIAASSSMVVHDLIILLFNLWIVNVLFEWF